MGQGFDECLQKTRHRLFLVWMKWLRSEWDVPSRQDWYTMQVAAEVARSRGVSADTNQMKMKFSHEKQSTVVTPQAVERSKAVWLGAIGAGRKRVKNP